MRRYLHCLVVMAGLLLVGLRIQAAYAESSESFHLRVLLNEGGDARAGVAYALRDGLGNGLGTTIVVSPIDGACGSANGDTRTTTPVVDLCAAGTASPVTGSGPWNWSCAGLYEGSTVSCSAAIQTYAITFNSGGNGNISGATIQPVNYGGSSSAIMAIPAAGYHFVNWTGDNGFIISTDNPLTVTNVSAVQTITANFAPDPINGNCGSAAGDTFTTAPVADLCAAGTASPVIGSGPWSWYCAGLYEGSTVSCSAAIQNTYTVPTITGTPASSVQQGASYSFTPTTSDADGDVLTFSIINRPEWATFNSATGTLTGTPGGVDIGTSSSIVISVSDGTMAASLPAFNITVVPSGGGGDGGTPVPILNGWWLLPAALAGVTLLHRRRKA